MALVDSGKDDDFVRLVEIPGVDVHTFPDRCRLHGHSSLLTAATDNTAAPRGPLYGIYIDAAQREHSNLYEQSILTRTLARS